MSAAPDHQEKEGCQDQDLRIRRANGEDDPPVTIYCNSVGKEATYDPPRTKGNFLNFKADLKVQHL